MRAILQSAAAISLLIGVSACASRPEPVEEVMTEEVVVAEEPTIVESVGSGEVAVTPTATGPEAGTLADFQVNVGERVYFDLDQYRLDTDDQSVLQRQAAWLQTYPDVKIMVAGNCDERGTREYNLALGERRASIVKDYLVGLGVDPARVETVSYGKERPLAGASNDGAWAQNRNGFTQIVSGASS